MKNIKACLFFKLFTTYPRPGVVWRATPLMPNINAYVRHVPTLQTNRLLLRPITMADIESLLPISYYNGMPIHTREGMEEKLNRIETNTQAGTTLHGGMKDKLQKILIGTVGSVLNEDFRRQGLMHEALTAVVGFGLKELLLDQIIACTDERNLASEKVLLKAGFTQAASDSRPYKKWIRYR